MKDGDFIVIMTTQVKVTLFFSHFSLLPNNQFSNSNNNSHRCNNNNLKFNNNQHSLKCNNNPLFLNKSNRLLSPNPLSSLNSKDISTFFVK